MSIEKDPGQMGRGSRAGVVIYRLAKDTDNQVFVEIGTWNGRGSTQCIMEPLLQRIDDCILYSLEVNSEFHNFAKETWKRKLRRYGPDTPAKLKLIWGHVIEDDDDNVPTLAEAMKSEHSHDEWPQYYREFFDARDAGCPNVISEIPDKIDVLLLDGGEFTSYADYQALKDRSKIIFCDDSARYKCEKVRAELLEDENFRVLYDEPHSRHGFCVFERVS